MGNQLFENVPEPSKPPMKDIFTQTDLNLMNVFHLIVSLDQFFVLVLG